MPSDPLDLLEIIDTADDQELLVSLNDGEAPARRLSQTAPHTKEAKLSEDFLHPSPLSPGEFTHFFGSVQQDLKALFAGIAYSDENLNQLERFANSDPSLISAAVTNLQRRIISRNDSQVGYNAGYSIARRIDFTDDRSIETDPILTAGLTPPSLNKTFGCVEISVINEWNTLSLSSGTLTASAALTYQIGYPDSAYGNQRLPSAALNSNGLTYWSESITVPSPLNIVWPNVGSAFLPALGYGLLPTSRGAVGEYTISYPSPTDWSVITIKPFSDAPMNLAGVLVLKNNPRVLGPGEVYVAPGSDTTEGYYLLTEYNSKRLNGNLYLDPLVELTFPLQLDCRQIILAFTQPHATQNTVELPLEKIVSDILWQQITGNTPVGQPVGLSVLPNGSLDLTYDQNPNEIIGHLGAAIGADKRGLASRPHSGTHTATVYHYNYGANIIDVAERRYGASGTLITKPIGTTSNLLRAALVPDMIAPSMNATIAPASAWFGPQSLRPSAMTVPLGTLTFDMTYGESSNWFPVAPLGTTQIAEPYILPVSASGNAILITSTLLRFQAIPNTPVYLISFDGQGNGTVLGSVLAPALIDTVTPTTVTWGIQLTVPGDFIVLYNPTKSSYEVDLGNLAEAQTASTRQIAKYTGKDIALTSGIVLSQEPYFDPAIITPAYEPNGDPATEYVPLSVRIDNFPITFPYQLDTTGHPSIISTFLQDTQHALDLETITGVVLETLTTASANPASASVFISKHKKWDERPAYLPNIYYNGTALPQYDISGNPLWSIDYVNGAVHFVKNTYPAGTITATYWYDDTTWSPPLIVNRTNFVSDQTALTPFDEISYPFIEYTLVENNRLIFNIEIPAQSLVTVTYDTLFNSVRVRTSLTRVDPWSQSATPRLRGFTFLAANANTTSVIPQTQSSVVSGDLELTFFGTFNQVNPQKYVVPGSGNIVPSYINVNWYRIVNAGTTRDTLRASYNASNGTTLYRDINNDRFIEPSTTGQNVSYQIVPGDGSTFFTLAPGGEAFLGLTNPVSTPTGQQEYINSAIVYSGQTPDFLSSQDWLINASLTSYITSVAAVTLV